MNVIKRDILIPLKEHLSKREITVIIGTRQVGKTTLMKMLEEYLKLKNEKTLFLNLDFELHKQYFISQESLIQKIRLEFGAEKGYIFIDEIQRKENAGIFLKGIYDQSFPYKFIVSGSGSMELKEKIHESLIGRKQIFEIDPVSFFEFVDYRTEYRYENRLLDFFVVEAEKCKSLLNEYLNFGGYPRVITAQDLSEKKHSINEIFSSYVERDIVNLLNIDKSESFGNLIGIMASQIGCLANYSKISGELGISSQTVKNYLYFALKTFVLRKILPYYKNNKKEITKSSIYYFYDLGLRNYIVNEFGNLVKNDEFGFLFQNLILNIILEKIRLTNLKVNFWRTKDKAEVDFVISNGNSILPVEVKYSNLSEPSIKRSLRSFIEKYKPEEAWIINLSLESEMKIENTIIKFIPFTRLYSITF